MSTTAYVMSFTLRAAPDRPALPDDEVMLEGMDARDLQMYDYGCRSCEAAVSRVLDGKDAGEGSVNEPWATLRRRLLGALVAANRRMGIPPGWQIERKGVGTALPYIVVTAPNKWTAVVSRLDRNPAIVLHMLAEALLNDKPAKSATIRLANVMIDASPGYTEYKFPGYTREQYDAYLKKWGAEPPYAVPLQASIDASRYRQLVSNPSVWQVMVNRGTHSVLLVGPEITRDIDTYLREKDRP